MRIQELIRGILDMLDGAEHVEPTQVIVAHPTATIAQPMDASPLTHGDDINRFRQIVDLANDNPCEPYGNTPNEKVASIDAVTVNAGGGWMAPKHLSDIRGDHTSMYPAHQHGVR